MKTIALFFGGLSNEAEVSIMSARNVIKYFDYQRYSLRLLYWHKQDRCFYLLKDIDDRALTTKKRVTIENFSKIFDIALLMTHGRYGEDGVLQALLESQNIKYTGCGVLSSALCMDKISLKNLMLGQKIPQVKYWSLDFGADGQPGLNALLARLKKEDSWPLFVKPSNSGSSVGITKVKKYSELDKAIRLARRHDERIIIEEGLDNLQEIEVAVLGNEKILVSRPGELVPGSEFYDYQDKYKLGQAQTLVSAQISASQAKKIRQLAAQVYRLASCRGFARVDFFIAKGKIYFNEINTLPGFTDISMFPLLMMDQGMNYRELLNKIIRLAL